MYVKSFCAVWVTCWLMSQWHLVMSLSHFLKLWVLFFFFCKCVCVWMKQQNILVSSDGATCLRVLSTRWHRRKYRLFLSSTLRGLILSLIQLFVGWWSVCLCACAQPVQACHCCRLSSVMDRELLCDGQSQAPPKKTRWHRDNESTIILDLKMTQREEGEKHLHIKDSCFHWTKCTIWFISVKYLKSR